MLDINLPFEPMLLGSIRFGQKIDLVETILGAKTTLVNGSPTPKIRAPQIENPASWELLEKYKRFVPVAEAFAGMSKMPGTRVGCVILGDAGQVLSSGWNGAPRGCRADTDDRLSTRESRLDWTVHAEANAIANAARSGTCLDGGVMVVTLMPCMTCAKLIAQAGIECVVCPVPTDTRWADEFDLTRELFAECDIDLFHYDSTAD